MAVNEYNRYTGEDYDRRLAATPAADEYGGGISSDTRRMIVLLNQLSGGEGVTPALIKSHIGRQSAADLKEMIAQLARVPAEKDESYLNRLISYEEFRIKLRQSGIEWDYILLHWEFNTEDLTLFAFGFVVGAGQNVVEGLLMCLELLRNASLYAGPTRSLAEAAGYDHKALAKMDEDFEAFIHGMMMMVSDPKNAVSQIWTGWNADFNKALDELDFVTAGKVLGSAAMDMWGFFKDLPQIAKSLFKAGKLSISALKFFHTVVENVLVKNLPKLKTFMASNTKLVLLEGFVMAQKGPDGFLHFYAPKAGGPGTVRIMSVDKKAFGTMIEEGVNEENFFKHMNCDMP